MRFPDLIIIVVIALLLYPSVTAYASPDDSEHSRQSVSTESQSTLDLPVVLVLGSGGLIGRELVRCLENEGYRVLQVKNRSHIDLREPGLLAQFENRNVGFVFFLACEVGGSKFLDSSSKNVQLQIIESNVRIYQNVFPWLHAHQIPFIFTSSWFQRKSTSYGSIKRLGEKWIDAIGIGKIVRLWNVFGHEKIGIKSHVISDWVHSCLQNKQITCRTTGEEERQFMHSSDCAYALVKMLRIYDTLENITHLSSGRWVTLRQVAEIISSAAPSPCPAKYAPQKAVALEGDPPNLSSELHRHWAPRLSLEKGIDFVVSEYLKELRESFERSSREL